MNRRAALQRVVLLACAAAGCAMLAAFPLGSVHIDVGAPGTVAARTVKTDVGFRFEDVAQTGAARERAASEISPVYVWNGELAGQVSGRVHAAFSAARAQGAGTDAFRSALGVHVPDAEIEPLEAAGFPASTELLVVQLVEAVMREPIVTDRSEIPPGPITVVRVDGATRGAEENIGPARILTPPEARQRIGLLLLERGNPADGSAAAAIARASVRANLTPDPLETEERRALAAASVPPVETEIHPGTILVRAGDVLTPTTVAQLDALAGVATPRAVWARPIAAALFFLLTFAALYQFAASWTRNFSVRRRDLGVLTGGLLVTALFARAAEVLVPTFAELTGIEAHPSPILFAAPVAGTAMLVRVLIGVPRTLPYALAAGTVAAVAFDGQAWLGPYVALACVVAAGAIEHTRERMTLVKAGIVSGTISAAAAVLAAATSDDALAAAGWGAVLGLAGGLISAFFALGLVPLFERLGFVTDYQLLELGSLNHPLLRQLMLRAPGSYHHSVMVGSLAEAACDAIGANGLQARVAAWFHDVGKSAKPEYFVENQRNGNRHDRLDPTTSARLIIEHVHEGERLAREHRLPQVIIDNILMHHGNGQLTYFLARARALAGDPAAVREEDFRYPGPKPNTREAGVIMLADKVEAATRTLREPNEGNIRAMVQSILNATLADGQLDDCPLTVQDLRQVCETFVRVLVAVYHQRIEYPATREISRGEMPASRGTVITLDIPRAASGTDDWESVDHLGRR